MSKDNIALVTDINFTDRDISRYGVSELSQFYNVFVIDCSGFIHGPKVPYLPEKEITDYGKYFVFENLGSLEKFLTKNPIFFFVDLLNRNDLKTFHLRKLFKKNGLKRVILRLGEIPTIESSNTLFYKILRFLKTGKAINKISNYIVRSVLGFVEGKPDLALLAGDESIKRYSSLAKQSISVNSVDYEFFLNNCNKKEGDNFPDEYAVFLDQSAPDHPDYKFHGNKPPVTKKNYYRSLNSFFDTFEKEFDLPLVIAKHPKSSNSIENWEGRQVIEKRAPALVNNSRLVLAHYSTAISFAVIANKPVIQILTNEYITSYRSDRLEAFADLLNLHTINVDNYSLKDLKKDELFSYDQDSYDLYLTKFIKSKKTKTNRLWDSPLEQLSLD